MNLKKTSSIFLLAIVCFSVCHAQTFNKAKLDSLLNAVTAANKGMGSLAISHEGHVVYQRAIGYADIGQTKPANIKTKYRIGSISKMFTGTMVFQLMEEGKLALTTPLSTFYPQLPNAPIITIGMMLHHRSGLHNFTNDPTYLTYLSHPKTEQEMLAIFTSQKPDFAPDSKADYSNTNFVLLGYIVEKLTKKTYAEEVKQRVITRIGLTDTYYGGKISTANNEAQSYMFKGDKWVPDTETDMSIPGGAGAMVSTPTDLDKFIEALFAGKLISADHLDMMKTLKDNYGMAMFKTPVIGKIGYGHTGGIDGFGSQVIYFPDDKVSIAYIHNGDANVMGDILTGALNIYFNKPYNIPDFKFQLKSAELDKYLGEYSSTTIPLKITVSKTGSTLTAQATGQGAFPLKPVKPGVFEYNEAGIIMEFEAAKDQMTIKQGGTTNVFIKNNEAIKLNTTDLDKYLGVYASTGFPLKVTVTKDNTTLITQATGQGAFPVTPTAPNVFEFKGAGIILEFDHAKNQMTLKQAGHTTVFTKEK